MATAQTLSIQNYPLTSMLDKLPSYQEPRKKLDAVDQNSNTPPSFKPLHDDLNTTILTSPIKAISWKDSTRPFFLQDQKVTMARLDISNLTEVLDRNKRRSPPTTLDHSIYGLVLGLPYGKIEIWDVNGTRTSIFNSGDSSAVTSTAALGNNILCGSEHLSLFDLRQQQPVWTKLDLEKNPIPTVSFVSDRLMMSGHHDHFSLWDMRRPRTPLAQPQVSITSHHWYGSRMISTGNNMVHLWQMTSTHLNLSCSLPLNGCSKVYLGPNKAAAIALEKLYTCTSKELKVTKTHHENPPSAMNPEKNRILTQTESGHLRLFRL